MEKKQHRIKINNENIEDRMKELSKLLKQKEKIIIEYSDKRLLKKIEEKILEQFGEKPLEYGIISISKTKK